MSLDLSQRVSLEAGILFEEVSSPLVPGTRAPSALLHERFDDWQRLHRIDEGVPFEKLLLNPQKMIEFGPVIWAQTAPQDEVLRRRNRCDRIYL